MTAKWEKGEGNQGVLTVDVDAKQFDEAIDQAFEKVKKSVNVPGFRKGKVPRKLFESRFGVESLYQDALDIVLPKAYSEAVEETGIEPVDQPEIDIKEMEQGKTLTFTANVIVKPEVELGDYKGLEVPAFNTEVNDEDVETELNNLRDKQAELAVVDETAQDGDTVVFDFEGFMDGEPFEGGKAENHSLELGSGQFIPGFEEQMIGLKADDEKDVELTFPEEYHAEDLAGKPAVFKVKVHEVKRKELPELDDEFAKDVDEEVESLEALRTKKKDELQHNLEHEKEHHYNDTVVEKAAENATVDIPDAMIKAETDRMMQEMEQRFQSQGISMDMYYQMAGTDAEGMKEQFKPEAEKRVRMNLVLEAIANAEELEASDERVEEELDKMAEMYQRDKEEIRQLLAMQGGVDSLKNDLRIQTAVQFLVDESVTVEAKEDKEA
ncbi:trigger factor [Geomicrobium sp. JCM 19039]|uniref:trigger factor n=1 Tax=Geomicrobium sp. JCM 19039 TaxID=1460636 RepID=UPI00045F2812|nr:trigger factor [Geomicrobium sp. JCM 19039]GAK12577.1 cell division trigger factor [Geomicrobium sp. JCM 19039]